MFRRGFGDGVINGDLGDCRPDALENGETFGGVPRVGNLVNGVGHIRSVCAKFFEENTCFCDEHSGIPQVCIALDIFSRFVNAGLLNETNHPMRAWCPLDVQGITRLDITERGRRRRRGGYQSSRCSRPRRWQLLHSPLR